MSYDRHPVLASVYHVGGVGQAIAAMLALWRKVRAPKGKVPGNAWGA